MKVLLATIVLARWGGLLAGRQEHATLAAPSNTGTNKSLKFVNIIKADLRRNNDDYVLLEPQNQRVHPARPVRPARPAPPALPAPRQPYYNRILQSSHHMHPTRPQYARPAPPHKLYTGSRRKDDDVDRSYADHNADAYTSYTRSKHDKSIRFNKLKQLLHKEKFHMRQGEKSETEKIETEHTETEQAETEQAETEQTETEQAETEQTTTEGTTSTATSLTTLATPASPPPLLPPPLPPAPPRLAPRTPPPNEEHQSPVMRQRKEQSPSPNQIDMAAARDPQIARIRIKGRLCQRSLMNLEGPSYDKEGKEVMPEHRPKSARGRQFHQTRAPALVLPRCCNCCKKSVLGCQ